MREGDEEQIATRDDGTRADENQRESPDEFRDGFPRGCNRHLPPPSAAYRCAVFLVSRSNPRTSSRDVRGGSAVETPHEFEAQFRRLQRGIREDQARDDNSRVAA